jgi:hypothetical protein
MAFHRIHSATKVTRPMGLAVHPASLHRGMMLVALGQDDKLCVCAVREAREAKAPAHDFYRLKVQEVGSGAPPEGGRIWTAILHSAAHVYTQRGLYPACEALAGDIVAGVQPPAAKEPSPNSVGFKVLECKPLKGAIEVEYFAVEVDSAFPVFVNRIAVSGFGGIR